MTKYLLAIIAALLVASLGAFWALDHTKAALRDKTLRIEELEASERSRKQTIKLLSELDTQHTQEITRARTENQALLDRIGAGSQRLSVIARCPAVRAASTTTGLDDAEARAELDPAHARRIVAIPAEGDDAIRQLTALQDWVRTACMPK
ncbi:lysis protein [Pseudomonas sp. GD03860]|uniref:lysis system i-spanin subunit Rz n=1 Tax=Pseudomonas sp. GD03860 TaxID=2975389 RepID=UPI002446C196|nr:lysis system i-spanin subunit Rz [Pseudomonas sp. GD03860]MDH0639084.1 lysis protein [Pseudomonas sp. GD03860]